MPQISSDLEQFNERAAERMQVPTSNLDHAVAEVFLLMMGIACEPAGIAPPAAKGDMVTAVVGLAGALSGACVLRMEQKVALEMAGLLVGSEMPSFDDTVKDALGEVCNMLAGAWKGKLPGISANCMLSVPAVVSGTNYELHMQKPDFRLDRVFRFGESAFSFGIVCDGL